MINEIIYVPTGLAVLIGTMVLVFALKSLL